MDGWITISLFQYLCDSFFRGILTDGWMDGLGLSDFARLENKRGFSTSEKASD